MTQNSWWYSESMDYLMIFKHTFHHVLVWVVKFSLVLTVNVQKKIKRKGTLVILIF